MFCVMFHSKSQVRSFENIDEVILNFHCTILPVLETVFSTGLHVNVTDNYSIKQLTHVAGCWTEGTIPSWAKPLYIFAQSLMEILYILIFFQNPMPICGLISSRSIPKVVDENLFHCLIFRSEILMTRLAFNWSRNSRICSFSKMFHPRSLNWTSCYFTL